MAHSKVELKDIARRRLKRVMTDKDGRFIVRQVAPGKYRLLVRDWGEAEIEVLPSTASTGNQVLKLASIDDGCLSIDPEY